MSLKPSGVLFAALCALSLAVTAGAASAGQRLVVEKNHSTRISLRGAAGSVIVANPEIADVNVIDSRTVYIVGKGYGNSSVIITDQMGRPLFDGEIVVTAAQKGAITVYKGLTPSTMICSNICTSSDGSGSGSNTTTASSPVALGAPAAAGTTP
ncbi:MAG: pilus assembly protein N-terminal domain-containing protein [Asticcacaulis sp.]|uniref:pilus assembly protein N-terminal domain-containing protein n=1 Tax=Asticcacaulis sp. TaxID=1872648 RepID=UPI0039E61FC4